ncbi:sulfite exporter TauE/SafE family protein [Parvularcula maris]|uniref:Probable membrane transporter protein n=1 Tax=Parvularcula maris TaxID=2965077 RepID=A0A9X2L920_9PROT|nr:sulfite exporter TauE/SafE family protein [Parvularcula maris]MCQ8185154.1 sulfite exporter TauE/SafE family protein [Parvularcula maris]
MTSILLLIATGAFAGTLGGLFGIGGGIVIVPVLYLVFSQLGVDPDTAAKTAVGTSLATIIVTSIRSMMAHRKRGAVDFGVLKLWGPFISIGAVMGALVAGAVSGRALLIVFGVGVIAIGIQRLAGKRGAPASPVVFSALAQRAMAVGTGLVSSLMGIGGGVIGVLLLTLAGRPMHQAVGTASGFGLAIAVPGAIGFALIGLDAPKVPGAVGYVDVLGFLAVSLGTVIFAPLGARLAHALPADRLARIFGGYLLVTGVLLLREAFFGA